MKISKEQAARNRDALLAAAARLFREKGVDGVGVAEISKAAGLTQGALYAHFPSKDALAAAAMADSAERVGATIRTLAPRLDAFFDYYLAPAQRDNLADGCPLAAAAGDAARGAGGLGAGYAAGFRDMVGTIAAQLPDEPQRQARAQALMAALIGGVLVSRAVHGSDPALGDEVLAAVRAAADRLAQ